jgi:hypothetical protein
MLVLNSNRESREKQYFMVEKLTVLEMQPERPNTIRRIGQLKNYHSKKRGTTANCLHFSPGVYQNIALFRPNSGICWQIWAILGQNWQRPTFNECSLSGGVQYKQYTGEKNIQKPYPLGIDCDFLRSVVGCL